MQATSNITSLTSLKNELIQFHSNDPLVNISAKPHLWQDIFVEDTDNSFLVSFQGVWEKLYKRFFDIYKETGIQTACYVAQTITWQYKEQTVESPLVLIPLEVNRLKNTNELQFDFLNDEIFINPFVVKFFKTQFDVTITLENLAQISTVLLQNPLVETIQNRSLIGQFHYYRFLFLKEIEELEKSDKNAVLKQLFGEQTDVVNPLALTTQNLLPKDPTQQKVLAVAGTSSFIIQGPPGTGKSQVLINIIGKLLLTDHLYAVVSEKKAALEVLVKKLNALGLTDFCIALDDQTNTREVYQQFQKTWLTLERFDDPKKPKTAITEFKKQQLNLILQRLQNENLSSGISYWDLVRLKQTVSSEIEPDTYHSIDLSEWQDLQNQLSEIKELPFELWRAFPQQFWQKETLHAFLNWSEKRAEFSKIFKLETQEDLAKLNQWLIIGQLQNTQNYSELIQIIHAKTKLKEVLKLKKEYFKLKLQLAEFQSKTKNWKQIPSVEQIQVWQQQTQKLFGKRKVQKLIDTTTVSKGITLEMLAPIVLELAEIQAKFNRCKQTLIDFQIFQPEHDFIELELLQKRYLAVADTSWKTFELLSTTQKDFLIKNQQELIDFVSFKAIQTIENDSFNKIEALFKTHLITLNKQLVTLEKLPSNMYYWLRKKQNWEEVEQQLIANEWRKFEQFFPELASKSIGDIRALINEIIGLEKDDETFFVSEIQQYRKQLFDEFHQLLLTKTTKLSDEEKTFRQQLKKGKSILVKEMTKSKQHLPLRELWNSDAKPWLQCLCPLWLMTPTQVAKHFPLTSDLFKLTLIDEASQIPASHIVGTIQRSEQVIIAGDSQQMSPSSFFQGEDKMDILSWAQYYFKNYHLRYHYRSQHPELIQFSNRFFYDNELTVFPTKTQIEQPIEWIFVENGRYVENQNDEEAKIIAKRIEQQLQKPETVGIVAFSQTQLQAIWAHLKPETKQLLEQRMEDDTAFFRPLDKVQGDECDVLLISFGYGKDFAENTFKLHLGPILKQGGEKRLNVLFSRAKKQIVFVSSVTADDFPISDNEVVQLLKNFFLSLNRETKTIEIEKPNFETWLKTIPNAEELIAKYRIYTERGWDFAC